MTVPGTAASDTGETVGAAVFSSISTRFTLALWAFCFVTFSGSIAASTGGRMEPWIWIWLGAISLTGLGWSFALAGSIRRLNLVGNGRRWMALLGLVVVVSAIQALLDCVLTSVSAATFGAERVPPIQLATFTLEWMIYFWVFGFYAVALEFLGQIRRSIGLERRNAAYAMQAAQARELARDAQLQMLRFQINPHFLFNTLNGISALVVAGRSDEAEQMIQKLGRFLRSSLDDDDRGLVSLDHELSAAEAYLDIEAVRFPDTLRVEIDCPSGLEEALIPGLILQPLVENAVKHAIAPSGGGGVRLVVRADDGDLTIDVVDSGGGPSTGGRATQGIGLSNVRRRLTAIYGDAAALATEASGDGFTARLRMPLTRSPSEAG